MLGSLDEISFADQGIHHHTDDELATLTKALESGEETAVQSVDAGLGMVYAHADAATRTTTRSPQARHNPIGHSVIAWRSATVLPEVSPTTEPPVVEDLADDDQGTGSVLEHDRRDAEQLKALDKELERIGADRRDLQKIIRRARARANPGKSNTRGHAPKDK